MTLWRQAWQHGLQRCECSISAIIVNANAIANTIAIANIVVNNLISWRGRYDGKY